MKNSISGPMKKAVMTVATPIEPKSCGKLMPENRQSAPPESTHALSVRMRQRGKAIRLCFSLHTRARES